MAKHFKLTLVVVAVVLFSAGDAWSRGPQGHGSAVKRGGPAAGVHRSAHGPGIGPHGMNPAARIHANPFHRLPAPGAGGAAVQRARAQGMWQHHVAQLRRGAVGRYHHLFTPQWYARHPGVWHHRHPRVNVWAAAVAWPVLANWVGVTAGYPYDYGTVYAGDTYFITDETGGEEPSTEETAQQDAQDPAELASQGYSDETTDQTNPADWLPLGVFTIAPPGSKATPDRVFQLSVNKNGRMTGSYYDAFSGQALRIQGAIDRTTQRAAWTVGSNRDTVMETNLGSFTQNQANVLVRQGKGQTDEWTMIRLEGPAASQTNTRNTTPDAVGPR